MPEYKYAIKKIEKKNKECIFVPMVRIQGKIKLINLNEWERIIKLYDTFERTTSYMDSDFGLSKENCLHHIEGFKKQVESEQSQIVEAIEIVHEEDFDGLVSLT